MSLTSARAPHRDRKDEVFGEICECHREQGKQPSACARELIAVMAELSSNPVPFSEPPYLSGFPSPYYTQSHFDFQKACRRFLWDKLLSQGADWEKEGSVPEHVFGTFCAHGMLLPNLPAPLPVEWLKKLGVHDILGVKVEDWDYMHTGIYCDEVRARSTTPWPSAVDSRWEYADGGADNWSG